MANSEVALLEEEKADLHLSFTEAMREVEQLRAAIKSAHMALTDANMGANHRIYVAVGILSKVIQD